MQIVSAEEVARLAPYPALIDALQAAFADPSACVAPPRSHHGVSVSGEPERTLLLMPAWNAEGAVVTKLVTVTPANAGRGLPAISGVVVVAEAATGAWRLLIDGSELTARRTAAASALAARHVARPEAETLFMVGSGRLSRALIEAHASQRPIRRVLVWSRRSENAQAVASWARERGFDAETTSLEAGADAADIISCATLSTEPLIHGAWLRPGVHLDLVGAFRPEMRESDAEAVARAQVVVDTMAGAQGEAGDLIQAVAEGAFDWPRVRADLHAICVGRVPGRTAPEEITLFKSVGASIEDFAAARLVERRILER